MTSELSDGSLNQLLLRQLLSLLAAAELGAWVLAPACGVHGSLSLSLAAAAEQLRGSIKNSPPGLLHLVISRCSSTSLTF